MEMIKISGAFEIHAKSDQEIKCENVKHAAKHYQIVASYKSMQRFLMKSHDIKVTNVENILQFYTIQMT